ncbi:retbindin [Alligator mississippiensis]|uniref:Riboflavin-binding protein-like n=1 Tax=Alligator mississippiensis TaxID=8496 RepID=A0A151MKL1_ALLMI|nr:retbindin [Alligator mississippiensis]XP_019355081.1 retbindin [Alligator mississippiensis]KYO25072.1 riboflavin-binding protein-like [Alligator mississippiensis]
MGLQTLGLAWALALALPHGEGTEGGTCLPGGKHKARPSPESSLGLCQAYAHNACCSPETAAEISTTGARDVAWDCCGPLSSSCARYLQQLECFYRCSPGAAHWLHPEHPTALHRAPLCRDFCQQWYNACRDDLTCAQDWVRDWRWGPEGNNCTGGCAPYSQMYRDGQDLCETIWGDAFVTEDPPCPCLTPGAPGLEMAAVAGMPCPTRVRSRRTVIEEDVEGSGSGF